MKNCICCFKLRKERNIKKLYKNIGGSSLMHMDAENKAVLEELIRLAYSLGASDAKIISSECISVKDSLADLCNQCPDYGQSLSCTPNVSGPSGFRELQKNAKYVLVLRIIVPSFVLFSDGRTEIMRLLHEITAELEQTAVQKGYCKSQAFAGGSCKTLFCYDKAACRVLSKGGECRHPQHARPSMSGFGIDVSELMKACGWPSDINSDISNAESKTEPDSMSWVAGMILI